jgi:hypothetical protein
MAVESAPMYIAVAQAKKRAKNPAAAANDIRSDMTMAFTVTVRKKSINTSSPVRDTNHFHSYGSSFPSLRLTKFFRLSYFNSSSCTFTCIIKDL